MASTFPAPAATLQRAAGSGWSSYPPPRKTHQRPSLGQGGAIGGQASAALFVAILRFRSLRLQRLTQGKCDRLALLATARRRREVSCVRRARAFLLLIAHTCHTHIFEWVRTSVLPARLSCTRQSEQCRILYASESLRPMIVK